MRGIHRIDPSTGVQTTYEIGDLVTAPGDRRTMTIVGFAAAPLDLGQETQAICHWIEQAHIGAGVFNIATLTKVEA